MERIDVTPEARAAMADFKAQNPANFDPNDLIYEGSNLVLDDHLQIDSSWQGIVFGGNGGLVWFCIPDWGNMLLPIDLIDYITDRAGPDGQTLPVFDEQQMQARAAKAAAPQNPNQAARAERKEERAHRREVKEVLREAVARLPHDQRKHARQVLRAAGVLGPNDGDD
jgi:hypothetical protein